MTEPSRDTSKNSKNNHASKIKTSRNGTNEQASKIKTSKAKIDNINNKNVSLKSRNPNERQQKIRTKITDNLLSANTENTTDTGSEVIVRTAPLRRKTYKTAMKVSVKSVKVVRKGLNNLKSIEKGEHDKDKQPKTREGGRYRAKIKTAVIRGSNFQQGQGLTAATYRNGKGKKIFIAKRTPKVVKVRGNVSTLPRYNQEKILTNTHVFKGYLKYRNSNTSINREDTTNTGYETIQEIRKGAITVKNTGIALVNGKEFIKKVKTSGPKIKTGRSIDTSKKRTLENNRARYKDLSKIDKTTEQVPKSFKGKASVGKGNIGTATGTIRQVTHKKPIYKSFHENNAEINRADTNNTGYEMIQSTRVGIRKTRNTRVAISNMNKAYNYYVKDRKQEQIGKKRVQTKKSIKTKTTRGIKTKVQSKNYSNYNNIGKKSVTKNITSVSKKAIDTVVNTAKGVKIAISLLASKAGIIGISMLVPLVVCLGIISTISVNTAISYSYILAEPEFIVDAKEEIEKFNEKATEKITKLLATTGYDEVRLDGDDKIDVYFQDVLAIMGVKYEQEYKLSKLEEIHNYFYLITTREETYYKEVAVGTLHSGHKSDESCTDECETKYELVEKKRFVIIVEQYNFFKTLDIVGFDEEQQEWAIELAQCNMLDIYPELGSLGVTKPQGTLVPTDIDDILSSIPPGTEDREKIIKICEALVGKISYGWGDKATPPEVPGSLDCSGFTDYVFKLAGLGGIGAGTYGQWDNSTPINKYELKIGDLGFLKPPSQSSDNSPNHVGIFVGKDSNGNYMFIHCQGGTGVVKTTVSAAGFEYFRRPNGKYSN